MKSSSCIFILVSFSKDDLIYHVFGLLKENNHNGFHLYSCFYNTCASSQQFLRAMPNPSSADLTILLEEARAGNEAARQKVYAAVYDYLTQIARIQRRRHKPTPSLRTAELVHEAYLKLNRLQKEAWVDRSHFFAIAATAMRQIVLNHARLRLAAKRGNNAKQIDLEDHFLVDEGVAEELISLNEALLKLQETKPRLAQVVECRFFAGLTVVQTAEALNASASTVKRDYKNALSWLYAALGEPLDASSSPVKKP